MSKLNQEGLEPKFHQLDIGDQASVDRLRDHLKETYGGLDVLINNAGIAFKVICSRLNASPYVFLSMRTILRTMETYQSALLRSSLSEVVLSPICTPGCKQSGGTIPKIESENSTENLHTQ